MVKKITDEYEPKIEDWELHITTVFPEVRSKIFLELRELMEDLGQESVPYLHFGLEFCTTKYLSDKFIV